MAWQIKLTDEARKNLKKLNKADAITIVDYLKKRLASAKDPTQYGKPLRGTLSGKYRFRVGDYRVICRIEKEDITVLVLRVGHRRDIYNRMTRR